MKAKHYFVHLVKQHHKGTSTRPPVHAAVQHELKKAFSKEQLTATLKRRLLVRRQRDDLLEQLQQLEQILLETRGDHHERSASLLAKIQRIKKKVEKS